MQELVVITEKPPARKIIWNRDQVAKAVDLIREMYVGKVFTAEQYTFLKKELAKLRGAAKSLDGKRITVKKEEEIPYLIFKGEVDEEANKIKELIEILAGQQSSHEKKSKDEKEKALLAFYEKNVGDLKDIFPWNRVFKPQWLNVSITQTRAESEIAGMFFKVRRDFKSIQALVSPFKGVLEIFYSKKLDLSATFFS